MLVHFAVDVEAIDDSATRAHIIRFLDRWERFGILVYPRRGDPSLTKRVSELAPNARKYWKATWVKAAKNNRNVFRWARADGKALEWSEMETSGALALFDDEFELGVLGESRATALEVAYGESKRCGRVEAIRFGDVDVSEEFARSEELGSAPVGVDESIGAVWRHRFRRLAAYSREVVVVDRYAARVRNLDGIRRLLDFLDRDAKHCRVTVYSSLKGGVVEARLVESMIKAHVTQFSGRGVASIGLRLFRDSDFRKYAHDRHLRFDKGVFRIGRGMRLFEHRRTRDATDINFIALDPKEREKKEVDLEQSGRMVHRFRVSVV